MDEMTVKRIENITAEIAPEIRTLAKNIFNNPELGKHEVKACEWQCQLLSKYGFEAEKGFCDIPTSYKAVYKGKKPGPKIAMLAEYDALPVLGHACGHNLIASMAVGSGIAMREFADEYGAEIYVIGTPAEETDGAKVPMANKGAFDEFDVVMMAHPSFKDAESINTIAMRCMQVEFHGKTAHAAAAPQEGINALDAVINFFNLMNAFRQQTKPDSRIHGVILDGGVAPNIIPDYTRALVYVRAAKMAYVNELHAKLCDCAKGAAIATGCTYDITEPEIAFRDTCSNRYLSRMVATNLERLEHDVMHIDAKTVIPGSSDLGDVSYRCPAVQLTCGMNPKGDKTYYAAHTKEFAEHAGSDTAIDNALDFVRAFTMTAVELMTNPEHLKAIKEEFKTVGQETSADERLPL